MSEATLTQTDDMTRVVERLRASKMETDKQMLEEGREAGRDWAKHTAEAIELRRPSEFRKGCSVRIGSAVSTERR